MKKGILALFALLLLLTGCSGQKQEGVYFPDAEDRQRVGVCFRDADDPKTEKYRQDLEQMLATAGYAVAVLNAGNDQSRQDQQVSALLDENVNILILEPVMVSALDTVIQQAEERTVPVVFVNYEPEGETFFVGCDAAQPGVMQAGMVTDLPDGGDLNGDGVLSYVYITGQEDHLDAQLRSQGCTQGLADAGAQAECLAIEHTDWSRDDGFRRCAAVLAKYGKDVEVIFCAGDELALGAIDAIKDGGRTVGQNVYLYGIGGQNQSLMLIRSGDLTGTVCEDISTQLSKILSAVQTLLAGGTPTDLGYVNHIAINEVNVEDYIED